MNTDRRKAGTSKEGRNEGRNEHGLKEQGWKKRCKDGRKEGRIERKWNERMSKNGMEKGMS